MTQLLVDRIAIDEPVGTAASRAGVSRRLRSGWLRKDRGRAGDCARGVQAGDLGERRPDPPSGRVLVDS